MKIQKRTLFIRYSFIILLSAQFASGCISFPGKELPTYTHDRIPAPERKSTVSFEVKAFSSEGGLEANPWYVNEVQKILTQSPSFAQVVQNKGEGDYHCAFFFRVDPDNEALSNLSVILSGATYFVLPVYAQNNIQLAVAVRQGGETIRLYTYRDHLTMFGEILLLPVMLFYPPRNIAEFVVDNMVMNFINDFSRELQSGALAQKEKRPSLPVLPDGNNALIYVVRPSGFAGIRGFDVFLDSREEDAEVGFLFGEQYVYFTAAPGERRIISRYENWAEIAVEAKSDKIYFIRADAKRGNFGPRVALTAIDAGEGLVHVLMSQPGTMFTRQR
jgi:hypothetical protein